MTAARARDARAGLTLIEMLVVLTIVAVASGAVVLGLGALDRGARSEEEARRLADRLQLASDAALTSGAPLLLAWDAQGYRFLRWSAPEGAWRAASDRLLAEPRRLPGGLALRAGGRARPEPVLISIDRAAPEAVLVVSGGGAAWAVTYDGIGAAVGPADRSDG